MKAGITTANFATPWRVDPGGVKSVWAIKFNYEPSDKDEILVPFNVGWVCGLIGLAKDTIIDYEVKDMIEELKI